MEKCRKASESAHAWNLYGKQLSCRTDERKYEGYRGKSVPFVNRINPASLISDAFYCINVYDDMTRYYRNLITLAVMCVVLVMASFFMVRRERYDSI